MSSSAIQVVGILGAGTMGSQIGYLCAARGYKVCMIDCSQAALEAAQAAHHRRSVDDFPDAGERKARLASVRYTDNVGQGVEGCHLVIEALPEDLILKREAFRELDAQCPPSVILASNSSSLRISRIEDFVRFRERVCNVHFYQQPGPVVEIMGGSQTTTLTLDTVRKFTETLGLVPVVLRKESTGFIYNRIWRAIKKECLRIVADGVTTPEEVDRVWMLLWNAPKGPFAWMDLVGLDVVRDIEMVYYDESGDESDKPPAFLDEMVQRGELGVKTGCGFYNYPDPLFERQGFLRGGVAGGGDGGRQIE